MFRSKKLFVLMSLIVIVLLAFSGCDSAGSVEVNNTSKASTSVTFCEDVDKDLSAIGEGDTFSTGTVTVRLESSEPFGIDKIKVSIYKVDGTSESIYDTSEQEVSLDWGVLALPISFTDPGEYKVIFTKNGTEEMGRGTVNIQ